MELLSYLACEAVREEAVISHERFLRGTEVYLRYAVDSQCTGRYSNSVFQIQMLGTFVLN